MPKNYKEIRTVRHQLQKKCMNCTKPPRPDKMYCQECCEKKAEKDRERYKKRKLERLNREAQRLSSEDSENKAFASIKAHDTELNKNKEPGHFGENLGVDVGPSGEQVRFVV